MVGISLKRLYDSATIGKQMSWFESLHNSSIRTGGSTVNCKYIGTHYLLFQKKKKLKPPQDNNPTEMHFKSRKSYFFIFNF